MAPFGDRTMIDGVDVVLGTQHVQNFSLALHELATNAAKYGALSNENGWVEIFWTIAGDGNDNILKFKWNERGGPPAVAPTRHGFGTSLLKAIFADVRIDYLDEGLTCEIDLLLGCAQSGATTKDIPDRDTTLGGCPIYAPAVQRGTCANPKICSPGSADEVIARSLHDRYGSTR
jgi:hypothetical protein